MKKLFVTITVTLLATVAGLYLRPSYFMIGQLDWFNVLTKGYFVGSFSRFFSQGLLDESFFYVMRFTAGGFVGGLLLSFLLGGKGSSKKSSGSKKKKS